MKLFIKFFAVSIVILAAILAGGYLYVTYKLDSPAPITKEIIINIPRGTTLKGSIAILNKKSILEPALLFEIAAKYEARQTGRNLIAGSYKFRPGDTGKEIIKAILTGNRMFTLKVTYPEGISVRRFADITEAKLGVSVSDFLDIVNSEEFRIAQNIPCQKSEGYLFPETYEFFAEPTAKDVVNKLLKQGQKIWETQFADQAAEAGKTKHEVLTLASIIEAETPGPEERPRVSGVYHNRLRIGMALQADPTVQFAIGQKRRVLYKDLENSNPYNTYKHAGLPPGPINSPGATAIDAALNPEKHGYYYFVAVGDGTHRHNFATNHTQHINNVNAFRRKIRSQRRK
ncbi:MAG: endolytic transglycosylase MltG [Candidatus Kapabacteria bacterium]|nr:endolytic transglycosylase MltG [Candidatus Kapabacteria bacterium]